MKKLGRPRLSDRKYDDPMPGYRRYTTFVKEQLLKDFKAACAKADKTYTQGFEEAVENWLAEMCREQKSS